jgi:hypothetical protein
VGVEGKRRGERTEQWNGEGSLRDHYRLDRRTVKNAHRTICAG